MRPQIVGEALQRIAREPEILDVMFEVLEMEKVAAGKARVTFVPPRSELVSQLVAAVETSREPGV